MDETHSLLGCIAIIGVLFGDIASFEKAETIAEPLLAMPPQEALKIFSQHTGLKSRLIKTSVRKFHSAQLPLGFKTRTGKWIVLARMEGEEVLIQRPESTNPEIIQFTELQMMWSGVVVYVTGHERLQGNSRPFDVTWFIPEFLRFRAFAGELFVASLCIELLALISPLFFQVAMDKVLTNQSYKTLDVLVIVLVVGGVLEVILRGVRQYTVTHTTTRIDARLGSKLLRRLIDLPISYFQSRSIGITVMRLTELESIREFLSGASNTLIMDLLFTIVFFSLMYYYSPLLTLVVACSIPFYFLISWLTSQPLQKRIEMMAQDSSLNNAFLTETLGGIETVKSLALESQMVRRWEEQVGAVATSNYRLQKLMNFSANIVQLIQKTTTVLILWFGARFVISGDLSIGQFIAFNMMANHVSQPILRLSELWRNYVQARVSIDRLADVLNTLPERHDGQISNDENLIGHVQFENVSFHYSPDKKAIENLSLKIKAGTMVALVGASGSGKSTIAKLIQKLYVAQAGRILIDGVDIRELDSLVLRRKMSIVLQENFLFNVSMRDNISLTDQTAPMEKVVAAAKLAGAHEFILEMPDGYDTLISEGGLSLSGGQRQRVAIARALMSEPGILIFDEATSALDDVSQAIVQQNMASIRRNRTVIVIAHRLSTVRDSDCIVVMDKGAIIEAGTHDELVNLNGVYAHLWALQAGSFPPSPC